MGKDETDLLENKHCKPLALLLPWCWEPNYLINITLKKKIGFPETDETDPTKLTGILLVLLLKNAYQIYSTTDVAPSVGNTPSNLIEVSLILPH